MLAMYRDRCIFVVYQTQFALCGLHAPEQEGVGIENGQLRASWRRHAPAPRGPWKGDAVRYHASVGT